MTNLKEKVKDVLWDRMEISRMAKALIAFFRTLIRILTGPILWVDYLIEKIRVYIKVNQNKPKEPTQRQIRSKMISAVIDGILASKEGAFGQKAVYRVKTLSIVFLESASFITTAIGMTIVASDISPAIAMIWALVIQGLAGVLSAHKGKWNNIILAICLAFSILSDYVCYVNAVSPYDIYIENQYTAFKMSYDLAWEEAIDIVKPYKDSDVMLDDVYIKIEKALSELEKEYDVDELNELETNLDSLKTDLENTPNVIYASKNTKTEHDVETGTIIEDSTVSEPIHNPECDIIQAKIDDLEEKIDLINKINRIKTVWVDLTKPKNGINFTTTIKNLISENDEKLNSAGNVSELDLINQQIKSTIKEINVFISENNSKTLGIDEYDLVLWNEHNSKYETLQELELPNFFEIRDDVAKTNNSIFDIIFNWFSNAIDSDFVSNAVDMKKQAELITNTNYERFMECVADLSVENEELYSLLYGNKTEGVDSLKNTYEGIEYRDALSKALEYLIHPNGKIIETYSRLVYACLADGIVLVIGFSLRRKKTSIYRVRSRRDLTNEEPRLISEAFYNLAAKTINDDEETAYQVSTLISHIEKFISYFEPEAYFKDPNLNVNYSLVCHSENVEKINEEYKELVTLLETLRYIKPIGENQYKFFVNYKLNKAFFDKDIPNNKLIEVDNKYCYLMTEGFHLYLSEKLNDLYEHIENDSCREEIKNTLNNKGDK